MAIRVALTHETRYRYDRRVQVYPQVIRLRPAPHTRTAVSSYSLKVTPAGHFLNWQQDPFGNFMARLVFPEPVDHLTVAVDLVAELEAINPFDFFVEDYAFHTPFGYPATLRKELAPYLERVGGGVQFQDLAASARERYRCEPQAPGAPRQTTVDFLVELNRLLHERIAYTIREEPGVRTPEETLALESGSCRDSGWLLVALLRELGIAARFVSGYLIQLTWDEPDDDGSAGPETDFTDLHAWTEAYVPGAGWIGLDPTSGLFAGEGHIPLAATPAPQSAAPISGALAPCEVEFDFSMAVRRLHERPRVTAPLDDAQWQALDATAREVDGILAAADVRLTMGGEPTFIADADRDAEEWNTAAVGPSKRAYGDELIRTLAQRFAPHGLLQHGQGKWYPGEQLPRWGFSLYWRTDGEALWHDHGMIAGEHAPVHADAEQAGCFVTGLCAALDLDPDYAQPLYEDPAEFVVREQQLPENVDPLDAKLDDPTERARLARLFERDLEQPAAFVLPLQEAQSRALGRRGKTRRQRWRSERWRTRRGRLFLLPGDSPAGFRLPLRSLAFIPGEHYPHVHPPDPFAPRDELPVPRLQRRGAGEALPLSPPPAPVPPPADAAPGQPFAGGTADAVRTALTVEPRGGQLCVFLPPLTSADTYVELVGAIEEVADALRLPVRLEGYPPPPDHRLQVLKVTPDPGVIELNVQPARSWDELVEITGAAYEAARRCGLSPTRYMLDGRPAGSGGGAHIVVGAERPGDSPFLRRPDLLASMLRFWQRHPSLAYFFTGLFVGSSSQAPRIDEAREDSLYQLEIALDAVPDTESAAGDECPPWLVDRLFRHLLTDVTGNTHRAEICIDKLFSPDSASGRLGLVELRAFEMAPHPRLALAQQLLVRALIALLWRRPCRDPLIRFGTRLHDQYLLPHWLWEDLGEVIEAVNRGLKLQFDREWFAALREFRFPCYGAVVHAGIGLELRAGLEPWHVLGEEGTVGGTTRFVDSSVERLQVRVSALADQRYRVTCNGYLLPLAPTGAPGEHVAGVRFRAWRPPSCLHPHIPAHGPLVFDVVDTWNGRTVGGCTYHVSHPGGRNYEFQPVNGREAESRRLARFEPFGHAPGAFRVRTPRPSPRTPNTLDLLLQ